MKEKIKKLEAEIENIKARNQRVELDKAWEGSIFRKFGIVVLTYLVISTFFIITKTPNPFLSSVVPVLGFILSTLTLGLFKNLWMKGKTKN